MPPESAPQPNSAERQAAFDWITAALEVARSRPTPKNGNVRRLTVSQYRNTLRELLLLEDDLTDTLSPDAVSEDGFVNNTETLEFSPLQMEAYLEIAADALSRAIVNPDSKPSIQNFRVDLGRSINPNPLPNNLILGANSLLLDTADYTVTEATPSKQFPFEPRRMRTKYRFIEGYRGNATVRGWREFDSIYHAVFACMRGSRGYPKGSPYSTVPDGLLLRPAIPTDEIFQSGGTYGPKANFKISLRELPDYGRFRVTVTAAKYDDGLLLGSEDPVQDPARPDSVLIRDLDGPRTVTIGESGIYQVDIYEAQRQGLPEPAPAAQLSEGLAGLWPLDGDGPGQLEGDARYVDSPFGKAISLDGEDDALVIPREDSMDVGTGDFTVAAWVHPTQLRHSGLIALGGHDWTQGWYLKTVGNKGVFRDRDDRAWQGVQWRCRFARKGDSQPILAAPGGRGASRGEPDAALCQRVSGGQGNNRPCRPRQSEPEPACRAHSEQPAIPGADRRRASLPTSPGRLRTTCPGRARAGIRRASAREAPGSHPDSGRSGVLLVFGPTSVPCRQARGWTPTG